MTGGLFAATLAAAVACGLSAGVLFAFSSFVMPALHRLDPGASIAAMQAINVKAVTPPPGRPSTSWGWSGSRSGDTSR